jgi:hypothetical protein
MVETCARCALSNYLYGQTLVVENISRDSNYSTKNIKTCPRITSRAALFGILSYSSVQRICDWMMSNLRNPHNRRGSCHTVRFVSVSCQWYNASICLYCYWLSYACLYCRYILVGTFSSVHSRRYILVQKHSNDIIRCCVIWRNPTIGGFRVRTLRQHALSMIYHCTMLILSLLSTINVSVLSVYCRTAAFK